MSNYPSHLSFYNKSGNLRIHYNEREKVTLNHHHFKQIKKYLRKYNKKIYKILACTSLMHKNVCIATLKTLFGLNVQYDIIFDNNYTTNTYDLLFVFLPLNEKFKNILDTFTGKHVILFGDELLERDIINTKFAKYWPRMCLIELGKVDIIMRQRLYKKNNIYKAWSEYNFKNEITLRYGKSRKLTESDMKNLRVEMKPFIISDVLALNSGDGSLEMALTKFLFPDIKNICLTDHEYDKSTRFIENLSVDEALEKYSKSCQLLFMLYPVFDDFVDILDNFEGFLIIYMGEEREFDNNWVKCFQMGDLALYKHYTLTMDTFKSLNEYRFTNKLQIPHDDDKYIHKNHLIHFANILKFADIENVLAINAYSGNTARALSKILCPLRSKLHLTTQRRRLLAKDIRLLKNKEAISTIESDLLLIIDQNDMIYHDVKEFKGKYVLNLGTEGIINFFVSTGNWETLESFKFHPKEYITLLKNCQYSNLDFYHANGKLPLGKYNIDGGVLLSLKSLIKNVQSVLAVDVLSEKDEWTLSKVLFPNCTLRLMSDRPKNQIYIEKMNITEALFRINSDALITLNPSLKTLQKIICIFAGTYILFVGSLDMVEKNKAEWTIVVAYELVDKEYMVLLERNKIIKRKKINHDYQKIKKQRRSVS